jgi:GT2 family glycosyltransferase
VTIVVATRNRRRVLLSALAHLCALPERPHVIVVDNASGDGTASAVAAGHPQVEVIPLAHNLGAVARNVGARAAVSPYVAFSDDDAWWSPGALRRAAALLDAHPRLAAVQARILVGPGEREDPTCEEMTRSPLPSAAGQPGHPLASFIACAVVFRRSAFLSAGGFSERLRLGGEEELLGWDLLAAGWQLSYVLGVVAHHHPPHRPGGRPGRRQVTLRNSLWTTWLRRPAGTAVRETARTILGAPHDAVTLRGLGRAVAGVPWVVRERRVVPPHVEALLRALD